MGSYKSCQDRTGSGGSSSSSTNTDGSIQTKSTTPTLLSAHIVSAKQPHWEELEDGPRDSVSTYASTTRSTADIPSEEPMYEVDDRQESFFPTDALSSTPSSFATLFPSTRRLLIRHDDATIDGNMNLRVDTVVPRRGGYQQDVILFHLRMYDLFSRKFSFRRYCRDSGRERLSQLSAGIEWKSSTMPGDEAGSISEKEPALGDTILMEFSNYAHVELRRRGPGTAKRYEYEYWSTKYQWRRELRKEGDLREVSYYLVDTRTSRTIAHMVPEILTPLEAVEEESKGGWVPPCSLWISDTSVYEKMPDIADVIVATGLVALVDDCIRRRWHHERRVPWILPARSSLTKSLERMVPRRLIGEVLQRRGSA
ncbi:hypothetical protein N7490_008641 [Penicillium lividum]|nr:hypothetical protein N7490_008641 [Penicillium lividum]